MPLVRTVGWQRDLRPDHPPASLTALLIKELDMDGSDAEAAVRRLMEGKSVDGFFDVGEEKASRAFMRQVADFGLTAKLYPDQPMSWAGSRPRQLFLKLSLAVLVGFGIWQWSFRHGIDTPICRIVSIFYGLLIICWLWSGSGGILDRSPQNQARKDRDQKLSFRLRSGVFAAVIIIGAVIKEPIFGLILLILAVGGIGCAFLIRAMNRD